MKQLPYQILTSSTRNFLFFGKKSLINQKKISMPATNLLSRIKVSTIEEKFFIC